MQFLYPVPKTLTITQTFQQHVAAARTNNWQNYNGGIDWAAPMGTIVVASQAGTVTVSQCDATGYGTHVRIMHADGYLTIYGHLQGYTVKVGDKVSAGQKIGLTDNTGFSTGPHIHFELRKNNIAVDPASLLVDKFSASTPATPTAPWFPPALPDPICVRLTKDVTDGLLIRDAPTSMGKAVGKLEPSTTIPVLGFKVQSNLEVWCEVGWHQYIAFRHPNYTYDLLEFLR